MTEKNDPKDWSKNDLVREVRKLRALLEQQMNAAPGTGPDVIVQGIVSSTTKEPIVQMRAGEATWQMSPAQTRQHAFLLMDAAVEAERDAATIAFLEGTGMDETESGTFLFLMREHRKEWLEDFKKMDIIVEEDD